MPVLAAAASSSKSAPFNTPQRVAASRTARHMGPALSWLWGIRITPARLTNPTVGLIPAKPFDDDGQTIEPSVSVPIPIAAMFAEIPAPVPELDPHGLRSRA